MTEDWSNDTQHLALHRKNKLHFKTYLNRKQLLYILIMFYIITVFTVFLLQSQAKLNIDLMSLTSQTLIFKKTIISSSTVHVVLLQETQLCFQTD